MVQSLRNDVSQIGKRIGFIPSVALTPDLERQVQASLAKFEEYLNKLGYSPDNGTTQVAVVERLPEPSAQASFDPSTLKLMITPRYASEDPGNLLIEYMGVVLKEGGKGWNSSYASVGHSLSCYFPASFLGRELGCLYAKEVGRWPSRLATDLSPAVEAIEGALWQSRQRIPRAVLDRAVFQTWLRTQNRYQDEHYEQIFSTTLLGLLGADRSKAEPLFSRAGLLP